MKESLKFDRHVLQSLDGAHDQNSIIQFLMGLLAQGMLVFRENEQPIQDQGRRRAIIEKKLPSSLDRLSKLALIVN
jgi:methyltransferase-like protein